MTFSLVFCISREVDFIIDRLVFVIAVIVKVILFITENPKILICQWTFYLRAAFKSENL